MDAKLLGEVQVKLEVLSKQDFNPWAVPDASIFLRYCCPECDYQCRRIDNFSEHALEKHERAKTLFSSPNLHKNYLMSSFCDLNNELPLPTNDIKSEEAKKEESTDEEAYEVFDEPKKGTKKRKRKGGMSERQAAKYNVLFFTNKTETKSVKPRQFLVKWKTETENRDRS